MFNEKERLPIFRKGREIYDVIRDISELFPEDKVSTLA